MATSGNYTITVNKTTLIEDALREAGVIDDYESVAGTMYDFMGRRLNQLIKHLQTKGLHLWRMVDCTLLLEEDKIEYTLGPSGDRFAEDMVRTVTTDDVAIAGTTYTISSSSGMTVSDVVAIEMDDGELHWDTIATIPDSTSITVSTGPTTAATSGATVYSYTSLAPKPLRITEAYLVMQDNEDSHTPLNIVSREEYMRLNSKNTASNPVDIYFRPDIDNSYLKVWPTSDDNIQRIVMSCQLPFETMDTSTNTLAMPDWWQQPLHLSLSYIAARKYRAPEEVARRLDKDSKQSVQDAEDFDVETTYIEMVPTVKWTD